ncbi:hypothetical protein AX16_001275 [Volvariella volvacea WC 439]|nr:hypothetical protein AX16_001275 [Volvariella volvacea WC 439]
MPSGTPSVHELCPEILSKIFLDTVQHEGWIDFHLPRVSHVCREWRKVAIDTPDLWNKIRNVHLKHTSWLHELQKRAKNLPLDVTLNEPFRANSRSMVELAHRAFPDLCRMRSLKLTGSPAYLLGIIRPYSHISNPQLRTLDLTSMEDMEAAQTIPFELFNNDMPNLKSLTLYHFALEDWYSISSFQSLTHLNISVSERVSESISMNAFTPLPCLETLDISVTHDLSQLILNGLLRNIYMPRARISTPPAEFKSLKNFCLSSCTTHTAHRLLSPISLPSCILVSIYINCGSEHRQDYVELLPVLTRVLSTTPISRAPIHALYLSPTEITARTSSVGGRYDWDFPTVEQIESKGLDNAAMWYLSLWGETKHVPPPRSLVNTTIIRPMVDQFNLHNLQNLFWEHHYTYDPRPVLNLDEAFFSQAEDLRSIEVETKWGDVLDGLCHVSACTSSSTGQSSAHGTLIAPSKQPVMCPKLEILKINCHVLESDLNCHVLESDLEADFNEEELVNGFIDELADSLVRRKEVSGRPLDKLVIIGYQALVQRHDDKLREAAKILELRDP